MGSTPPTFIHTPHSLLHVVNHVFGPVFVFYPLYAFAWGDFTLARAACAAAHAHTLHINDTREHQWHRIARMLEKFQEFFQSVCENRDRNRDCVISQLHGMQTGDVLAFFKGDKAHASGILLTKQETCTMFQTFDMSIPNETRACSHPVSTMEVPNAAFHDPDVQLKLANLLSCRSDENHLARFLASLHNDILQTVAHTVDVPLITKYIRVRDKPIHGWSRSSLWLFVKVVICVTLERSPFPTGRISYKVFMLFFMCTLASDANIATLHTDLLQLMACKIRRRFNKLESSVPDWLSKITLSALEHLCARLSTFRNLSQDELERDTRLSLTCSQDYIRNALANHHRDPPPSAFVSDHRIRGTIHHFLSSNEAFCKEDWNVNRHVTFYDAEKAVEEDIDDWIANVSDVDGACSQLEIMMDGYMDMMTTGSQSRYIGATGYSILLLTGIELFIALDKLLVRKIPLLSNYSPEIPTTALESLVAHNQTDIHRISRAYQYISARQSQSQIGWSIVSDEDSLPARYYDQSPHLQQLKAQIEQDTMCDGLGEEQISLSERQHTGSQSLLPASPLHAKVVVFELQCPSCIRIWRSAAVRLLYYFSLHYNSSATCKEEELSHCDSALQRYYVNRSEAKIGVQFAYFYSARSENNLSLHYEIRDHGRGRSYIWGGDQHLECWKGWWERWKPSAPKNVLNDTSCTPNDTLAAQVDCPASLSLDEFVAYGQLRSGGFLQWFNILHGIRGKTLKLHSEATHDLLFCALSQVGPLDLNTGTWFWHKELDEPSFYMALIDELEHLFADVGAQLIDRTMMHSISLLLTRMLASSPSETILGQITELLRKVRRKMFDWVQELSYNLGKEPTNETRRNLLQDMSFACLSTFDVDTGTLWKHFLSEEDISAALFCALLANEKRGDDMDSSEHLRGHRDRVFIAFEPVLSDAILLDPTDRGIDLAVRMFFPSHKPGTDKWKKLEYPNAHWLTCRKQETTKKPSEMVHLNLLNGDLQIDGQSICDLFRKIRQRWSCKQIFPDQGLFVLPQIDLPDQDMTPKQKAHFFLRDNSLVVRMVCNDPKEILEWIPSNVLEYDLPTPLLDGHIHWLDLSRGIINILPLERPLNPSPEDWRIIDCGSSQCCAYKGSEKLIDKWSLTWAVMSNCFQGLNVLWTESSSLINDNLVPQVDNLIITTFPIESNSTLVTLSITLPRHGLSFFLNEQGDLESRDFKHMIYDSNPQLGETLSGIDHLFVLRQRADLPKGLIPRRILVPDGIPKKQVHVASGTLVRFLKSFEVNDRLPTYHTYDVDTELGCLIGNGSLRNARQLAYMLAATSQDDDWDPFTGKTGLQAAVSLLRSGGCRSIARFKYLWEDEEDQMWISVHPEVNMAYNEIRGRYYWRRKTGNIYEPSSNVSQKQQNTSAKTPSEIAPFHLFSRRLAPVLPPRIILPCIHRKNSPDHLSEVNKLLASLDVKKPCSSFQEDYIACLGASALLARDESHVTCALAGKKQPADMLQNHYLRCRANYFYALEMLKETLGPSNNSRQQVANQPDQWPPVTGDTLLRCLASTSTQTLPGRWKTCLVSLALLLLDLQRARRLLRFALDGLEEDISKELEHEVCDGWDPEEYPDWLLIQIQGNFLIRRNQAEVAMEMMSPTSGRNTVMQVNMGEGKSSMIIPMVAAVIADGKQLARVIVPKSLTVQMFDLLVARLGWLVNRPIYHLPFSRTPEFNRDGVIFSLQINDMHKLMSQCMAERGILLVQPEHVASLRLMCMEEQMCRNSVPHPLLSKIRKSPCFEYAKISSLLKLLPEESFIGSTLRWLSQPTEYRDEKIAAHGYEAKGSRDEVGWMGLQKWMDSHVRDILDECDEILHSRFQLIYTIGFEQHIEGYPDRWTITQQVLRLVTECAPVLLGSFQVDCGPPGSFPLIGSVSGSNIDQRLKSLVIEFVMRGRINNLDFRDLTPELQSAIRNFISDENIPLDTAKVVEEYAKYSDQACMWTALLVLRGLLASNILLSALLERRWRVDYGLGPSTMLAVPYRAKDMPAPNTHFGHPDITIVLTCLSYYYSGLSEEQLRTSFQILLDQDDPHAEYAFWVKDYSDGTLPESLRILGEMNLRSSEQWDKVIYPLFFRNQAAIDLYLSRVVFPKEAKEFPFKLSASSWDLVGKREKVTTGFSGTNDGRWLLPMTVGQKDLDHQQGVSARVLAYLLQPENDFYMTITGEHGERLATTKFLQEITRQQPEIRVLLDVGAQILDSSNHRVAEAWLDIARDAAGAIYFDDKGELMLLMQNGASVPMLFSTLSQQLERCVVYLDHAHTRGTDLKLPIGLRAAVTLGPRLTKDRLVQGCMRMRKLGHGHSVMFFAPLEVDKSIRTMKKDPNSQVTTADILRWAIHETWADIQRRAPYWAQQGMDHRSREDAWLRFCNKAITSKHLSDVWLQRAARPLDELFAPRERNNDICDLSTPHSDIQQRCNYLGVMSLSCVQIEEQEREVDREREREREEDLPPKAEPAAHFLHPDVEVFVKTGVIPALYSSSAFRPIFTTLGNSSAATREVDVWSPFILATADFCNTIKPESTKGTVDQYLRPVQWVLSSQRDGQVLVLISPFEANRLLPEIRSSEYVHLHLYAPRKSQRMRPCDDLTFYVVPSLPPGWTPPWALIDQLNVFAGQLYLDDYNSYLRLCRLLGVPTDESPSAASKWRNIRKYLFGNEAEGGMSKFSSSPLPFVMALLAIRNKGKPFWHTHMGKILYGQVLRAKDFAPRYTDIKLQIEDAPTSPMELDPPDGSMSLSLYKRRLEMAGISDEPQCKRPRHV